MGERIACIRPSFNRSIQFEGRPERLSCETGALLLREADERLGLSRDLARVVEDKRDPSRVVHSMEELLRTAIILPALGWRDQDDADFLRWDAAVRLAISDRRGISALLNSDKTEAKGLGSQPTLSRLHEGLSSDRNRSVLREFLMESAARRLKAGNGGHRQRYVTIDIDSLPIEVDGSQPGAEYNGHYDAKIFHPLIATAAELGDILDVKLRPGSVHTAEGGLEFILNVVRTAEKSLCQVAAVRMDAGFPDEETLQGLESQGVPYVARIKTNAVLDAMAEPYLTRPRGRPPTEGRTWTCEMSYQAQSWSRARRLVLIITENPRELFLNHFWLVTSWTEDEKHAEELLSCYRQRGTAEGVFGELMDSIEPALSSNRRPKSHYRGQTMADRSGKNLSFAVNEARLILAALAFNLAHAVRCVAEKAFQKGLTIKGLQEKIFKVAARVTLHARRINIILASDVCERWLTLWSKINCLGFANGRA